LHEAKKINNCIVTSSYGANIIKTVTKNEKKHNKIIQQQNNRLNTKHVKTSVVKSLVLVLATHSYSTLTISDGHSAHVI